MKSGILESLYRQYYGDAVRYMTALCGDTALAEDLVTDAFIKAYLCLPDDVQSFRFWLLRVCKNEWIDFLRKQKHLQPEDALQYLSSGETPESCYLAGERSRALWKAVGTLQPLDRELVTLHYFSGLSLQEAAELLGKSYAAVRQRMSRLRVTLKQRMEEQGYEF